MEMETNGAYFIVLKRLYGYIWTRLDPTEFLMLVIDHQQHGRCILLFY